MTDAALSTGAYAPLPPIVEWTRGQPSHQEPDGGDTRRDTLLRRAAVAAIVLSLLVSAVLAILHRTLGGAGDEVKLYYPQAARLLPFLDHYYGPGYFVALRAVKIVTGLGWFGAGKLLSWLSAAGFLVVSARLLLRTLPRPYGYLAIALVALNATQITMSYSTFTISFGALLVILAVAALERADESDRRALGAGLLFALAALTRFQANGFLLGAIAGLLFWSSGPWRRRVRRTALLVTAFVIPVAAWYLFLKLVQGRLPVNYNFIHLTRALGQFQKFTDEAAIVRQYGGMFGVLSTPGAPVAIARMAVVEAVKFPFRSGLELLLFAAAWLLPGACLVAGDRRLRRPWVAAMAAGFVLTNVGSRGWLHYYTQLLPFFAFLICAAAAAFDRAATTLARRLQWAVLFGAPLVAAPVLVAQQFHGVEWPEWAIARAFVVGSLRPTDVVSSTAASLEYGTPMRFIDLDDIYTTPALDSLVPILRARQVTRLVVTERHSLFEHPQLASLLGDDSRGIPAGLRRDTLIVHPARVAVFTVLPP